MKEIEFIPLKMVAGINFGETRAKVRTEIGLEYKEFRKSRFSKNTTDAYKSFHVYYNPDNHFEALEVFPEIRLKTEDGYFPEEYCQILEWMQSFDPETIVDESGAISRKLGIAVYGPNEKAESIVIAKEGYFK